jgi:DNA primase
MIDHASCAVVFVVYDNGQVAGYQRRYLFPNNEWTKAKTSEGFSKTEHILVFMNPGKDIAVCEGPFTGVSAWHFGYTGVVTFGASVSETQIKKILDLANLMNVRVGIAFDDDDAGSKGTTRIRSAMHWAGKTTFKLKASTGNDLNDAWKASGQAILVEEKTEYNPAIPELKGFC